MNRFRKSVPFILVAALVLSGCGGAATTGDGTGEDQNRPDELNIYSARHYDVDKDVYSRFTEETGIRINLVEGKDDELLERLSREGDQSPADLILTVGAENIYPLQERNLLEAFDSSAISAAIPAQYRGEGWMAITSRARVIAYSLKQGAPEGVRTYRDLLDPRWQGKILVRSSSSSYNVALLASLAEQWGEEQATAWAEGIVANMAREPEGNDRDQMKAVAAGQGELAIVNSYYYIRMLNSADEQEVQVAQEIGLLFPEDTHQNISVAGLIRGSSNRDHAIRFLEYLASYEIQQLYAEENGEFPVNPEVALPEVQKSWGEFTVQQTDFSRLGAGRAAAAMMFDRAGWK